MAKRARGSAAAEASAAGSKRRDTMVSLNVGGQKFTTLRSTLRQVPGSVLDRMFDEDASYGEPIHDDDGCIFIDGDPEAFPVVLNFLRYGRCVEASSMPSILANKVEAAADYFGLGGLAKACEGAAAAAARRRRQEDNVEIALGSISQHLSQSNGTLGSIAEHFSQSNGTLGKIAEHFSESNDALGYLEPIAENIGDVALSCERLKDLFDECISEGQHLNEGNALRMVSRSDSHD